MGPAESCKADKWFFALPSMAGSMYTDIVDMTFIWASGPAESCQADKGCQA